MENIAQIYDSIFGDTETVTLPERERGCIMIIDDNPEINKALGIYLKDHFELIACLTFGEAQSRLTDNIKFVLLDIKMAEMDGIEAFHRLRAMRPNLKIVFHSAYPGSNEKNEIARSLDHSGFLVKGEYTSHQLLEMLKAL